jgi:hypothetical protein
MGPSCPVVWNVSHCARQAARRLPAYRCLLTTVSRLVPAFWLPPHVIAMRTSCTVTCDTDEELRTVCCEAHSGASAAPQRRHHGPRVHVFATYHNSSPC